MAIGLGVGLGIGMPVLFALLAWWLYVARSRRKWPLATRKDRTSELPAEKELERNGIREMLATSGPHEAPTEVVDRGPTELPAR